MDFVCDFQLQDTIQERISPKLLEIH